MKSSNVRIEQVREVVEIKKMFDHIHKSADLLGYSKKNLKFFGYPEGSIHYEIFRAIVLDELEITMKWRYRDHDTNGVTRCQILLSVYKVITTDIARASLVPLTKVQLDRLVAVSLSMDQAA